ncbi:MAG: DUF6067 family protein, partial [bacterium]|nr:DUF6067 family protein [bacterium]
TDITLNPGEAKPFSFGIPKPGGQFVFAYKIVDTADNSLLLSGVSPVEVKTGIDMKLSKRFLTKGGVMVTADASGVKGLKAGDEIKFTLRSAAAKDKPLTAWTQTVDKPETLLERFMDMSAMPVGKYILESTAVAKAGGEKPAYNSIEFNKPAVPDWWGNKIGYSDKVPWPWTPVKAGAATAGVWGRNITWSGGALPSQIESQGRKLLASPLAIDMKADGKDVVWKKKSFRLVSRSDKQAVYESDFSSGNTGLKVRTEIDYDGLITFKATVSSSNPVDRMIFRMPMRQDAVTHYGVCRIGSEVATVDRYYKAGKLDDYFARYKDGRLPFTGLLWLGDDKGGIQWVCEEDKGWSNADRNKVTELIRQNDALTLQVNLIDKATVVAEPRTFTWALMPAPVKDMSWYLRGDVNTASGITGVSPKVFDREKLTAGLKAYHDNGINYVLTGGWNTPYHADVWVRGHNRINLKESIDEAHRNKVKVFLYGSWGYDVNGDEAADFGDEMVKQPLQPCMSDTFWYNPEGPWVDFYMAGLKHTMENYGIDGIYLDGMPCTGPLFDPLMDEGYVDEQGRKRGKWPVFALRRWAERMYNVMHLTERQDGIVYTHDSSMPVLAIQSFSDFRCGGEETPNSDRLAPAWPLDEYFVKGYEKPYGIPYQTLWYNWWNRSIKENQVLAVTLLFGQLLNRTGSAVTPWTLKSPSYDKMGLPHIAILNAYKAFNIGEAQWWPYWKPGKMITLEPSSLKASFYLHPGKKALVVVSNLEPAPAKARITFDLKSMGFTSEQVKATDALLGQEIPMTGGTMQLDVQDERYRLILLETK